MVRSRYFPASPSSTTTPQARRGLLQLLAHQPSPATAPVAGPKVPAALSADQGSVGAFVEQLAVPRAPPRARATRTRYATAERRNVGLSSPPNPSTGCGISSWCSQRRHWLIFYAPVAEVIPVYLLCYFWAFFYRCATACSTECLSLRHNATPARPPNGEGMPAFLVHPCKV